MVVVVMLMFGCMLIYGMCIVLFEGDNVSWFFYCGEYLDVDDFY